MTWKRASFCFRGNCSLVILHFRNYKNVSDFENNTWGNRTLHFMKKMKILGLFHVSYFKRALTSLLNQLH